MSKLKVYNSITDEGLERLLTENKFLSPEELAQAKELKKAQNISLYEAVIKRDLLSDENLGKLVSEELAIPFVNLSKVSVEPQILKIIPEIVASKHKIIAFDKSEEGLKVATSRPEQKEILSFISKKTGERVKIYFATEADIAETLRLYKKDLQQSFDDLLKEQIVVASKSKNIDAPILKIVDTLIEYAYDNKASDIHIEPDEHSSVIRFRIDGVLHDVLTLPKEVHPQVVTRIKVLSKLRIDEHASAQDGKMQATLPSEEVDIRVSIVPIVNGEKAVLRLLSSRSRQFSLADLGMLDNELKIIEEGFKHPYGMVLSTGPTGSGKTTTIYAILKILNVREKNIATIEDPVEYEIEGINQIQVNPKTNLTFAEGLKSILRQDPNIIFVGEIRDNETASIAINSALTGHLVLSTLHTNHAAASLPRLVDMGVEPFLIASTINVVVAQRLVRKICEKCKVSYTESAKNLSDKISPPLVKKHLGKSASVRMYKGKGCAVCHSTGYTGRVGLFEVLQVSSAIQELITQKGDAEMIKKKAIQEGMTTILEDGLAKVQSGVTTLEEVLRVTVA